MRPVLAHLRKEGAQEIHKWVSAFALLLLAAGWKSGKGLQIAAKASYCVIVNEVKSRFTVVLPVSLEEIARDDLCVASLLNRPLVF